MNLYSIWLENGKSLRYEDWNMNETGRLYSQFDKTMCESTLVII